MSNIPSFRVYASQTAAEKLGFVLKLVLKISNAITGDKARGAWMVSPTRQEEQAAERRAGDQSCLIIKSPVSEGKKKKGYNFPGLEKKAMEVLMCHGAEY